MRMDLLLHEQGPLLRLKVLLALTVEVKAMPQGTRPKQDGMPSMLFRFLLVIL